MMKPKRKMRPRTKGGPKFMLPTELKIDYKNFPLLQKFLSDRGKIIPRRISGITATQQRQLSSSIKMARYLGLLITGGIKK